MTYKVFFSLVLGYLQSIGQNLYLPTLIPPPEITSVMFGLYSFMPFCMLIQKYTNAYMY